MDWVKDVLYGPAGNVTQTRYLETKGASAPQDVYYLQTHTYNSLNQLTRMTTVREGGGGGTIWTRFSLVEERRRSLLEVAERIVPEDEENRRAA